jgi:F-type H+-transporting ATPase subunit gamma
MAGNQQAIKSRIRSVKSTKKITKAMQMIANAKLAKQRKLMEGNRYYAMKLQEMVQDILSVDQPLKSKFFKEHQSDSAYTIFFCSDLGLCGGYNTNVMKFLKQNVRKEDPLVIIGTHSYSHFEREGYNLVNKRPVSVDSMNDQELRVYIDDALDLYLNDKINKIQVCYTRFVNTMTFEPTMNILLPYQKKIEIDEEKTEKILDIIFDPSLGEVLDNLIVEMVHNVAYALSLETKTAEQGSRRLAMETATDNAEELEEKLVLQFNQARQAAITQELTEIVGTANAL